MTRVLVSRQPIPGPNGGGGHDPGVDRAARGDQVPSSHGADDCGPDPGADHPDDPGADHDPGASVDVQGRLRAAMALLPPTLGGAPSRPLDVGRTTRVVQPAQRMALAVRDRGCVFPGCERPLAWCDAHHLWHWIDGGPTDLANLAMVCRAHHRTVHEGGWQLTRGPDGRFTATPARQAPRPRRRGPPTAA